MTSDKDMSSGILVAETVSKLSDMTLNLDSTNQSADIRYTDEDVMNVLHIFNHIVSNYVIHHIYQDKKVPLQKASDRQFEFGSKMREFIREFTGIDPATYYQP